MVRWVLVGAAAVAAVVFLSGTGVLADVRSAPERARGVLGTAAARGHSKAQISPMEFIRAPRGAPRTEIRNLLGEPEDTSTAIVEGLKVECWLYGIAADTGAFQLCFENGRLSSRFRYG